MKKQERFEITYKCGSDFSTSEMILVDKLTGVNYLFVKNGYGGGLTPLLDGSGNVVVSPVRSSFDPER